MTEIPTIPHFEALGVDISTPEGQGHGIMKDKPRQLILKKQTFQEMVQIQYSIRFIKLLFWHGNANFAIILNLQVSLVRFQKFFLFWVGGIILEEWEVKLATDVVIQGPQGLSVHFEIALTGRK